MHIIVTKYIVLFVLFMIYVNELIVLLTPRKFDLCHTEQQFWEMPSSLPADLFEIHYCYSCSYLH